MHILPAQIKTIKSYSWIILDLVTDFQKQQVLTTQLVMTKNIYTMTVDQSAVDAQLWNSPVFPWQLSTPENAQSKISRVLWREQ